MKIILKINLLDRMVVGFTETSYASNYNSLGLVPEQNFKVLH
jgi:hypothetical protein